MGVVLLCRCKKCKEEYKISFGVGKGFQRAYKIVMDEIEQGKYGTEIKQFLIDYPDGVVDMARGTLHCRNCGELKSGSRFGMYVLKDDSLPKSEDRVPRALQRKERKGYRLLKKYRHICSNCGKRMDTCKFETIKENLRLKKLRCSKCGGLLVYDRRWFWD